MNFGILKLFVKVFDVFIGWFDDEPIFGLQSWILGNFYRITMFDLSQLDSIKIILIFWFQFFLIRFLSKNDFTIFDLVHLVSVKVALKIFWFQLFESVHGSELRWTGVTSILEDFIFRLFSSKRAIWNQIPPNCRVFELWTLVYISSSMFGLR